MKPLIDLGFSHVNKDHRKVHRYLCACGNTAMIPQRNVLNGTTISCGCMKGKNHDVHGLRNHRLYSIHAAMMSRCYNSRNYNYKHYGGRGIKVNKSWHDIKQFISDMDEKFQKGLTLERIDNNKEYSKSNCRWVSYHSQARNKRNNIVFKGECATDAAKRLGGSKGLVIMRLRRGWSIEKAFNERVTV